MTVKVWRQPEIIAWTDVLLQSYQKLLGQSMPLIESKENEVERAKALFFAPFVVASHGTEEDPILNYGNQMALDLWDMSWEDFTRTPSRLTAEPINRPEREVLLERVAKQGFIDNYQGVRISSTGRRFAIEKTVIWNLVDSSYGLCGQAATFWSWRFL